MKSLYANGFPLNDQTLSFFIAQNSRDVIVIDIAGV